MTDLLTLLDEYLATRRALGAGLVQAERLLRSFLAFLAEHEAARMTTRLALQWATSQVRPAWQAQRLGIVRAFARYAHVADPRHEVPPEGLLKSGDRRATPYIYSDKEIADLIAAARRLRERIGLRACTYPTLLALLAVTGMRSSEPLRLDRDDVDSTSGVLTVRQSKFGKSRCLPVHESTCQALADYAAQRDRLCPHPIDPAFFLSERGTRIKQNTLQVTFVQLSQQIGLRNRSDARGSRLHDLRHTSATHLLRAGVDLNTIRAWLGHVKLDTTNVYAEIDFETKAKALALCDQAEPRDNPPWKQDPDVMAFLRAL